jgi:hypothetical protein
MEASISASPWRDTMMAISASVSGLIMGSIMNCPCHMAKICGCWGKQLGGDVGRVAQQFARAEDETDIGLREHAAPFRSEA